MSTVSYEKEFDQKTVFVTGATQGAGLAIAKRFAAGGARVLICARKEPEEPLPFEFIAGDLSSAAGCEAVAKAVLGKTKTLDVVVHNVGGSSAPTGGFQAATEEVWQNELNLNLLAAVRLDRLLIPSMIQKKSGSIVHISSIQRKLPLYDSTLAYAAAKAALTTYSKGLSNELALSGIRVNSVSPGGIETDATNRMIQRMAEGQGITKEQAYKSLLQMLGGVPWGRFNTPEEIAELVVFLSSSRASSITGVDYIIDGGTIPTI